MAHDPQFDLMRRYGALLHQCSKERRDVMRDEMLRFREFQDPANFKYETTDQVIGWYEAGIKRLEGHLIADQD